MTTPGVTDPLLVVGVLSDTHGDLRPDAAAALADTQLILVAGDIVSPQVIPALARIAKVVAVRGNMDDAEPTADLPLTAVAGIDPHQAYLIHDLGRLDLDPRAAGLAAVIHGHTHRAEISWRGEVLYLNPGTCGPIGSSTNRTLARLLVYTNHLEAEIVRLAGG